MALRIDPRKTAREPKRDAKVLQYIAPEAPRGEEGKPTKSFRVAQHANIFDNDGVKRFGGEMIELTEAQVNFFANLGYIEMDIQFTDERDTEIEELRSQLAQLKREAPSAKTNGAAEDAGESDAEAEAGDTPDSGGGEHGLGDTEPEPARQTRAGGGGRKRRSL